MRIGIDATSLCRKATGIEIYARNLIKALLDRPRRMEYVVFFRGEIHPELRPLAAVAEFRICPRKEQLYCEQIWLPQMARKTRCDLVHYPAFPPGFFTFGKHVVTIHDAALWRCPAWCSWKGRLYFRPLAERAAKRTARIITISEHSRRDIIRFMGTDPGKVVVAGISCNPVFRPLADTEVREQVRTKHGLPDKFILSVGSLEPRKNFPRLLEAFRCLKNTPAGAKRTLVLVGRRAWGTHDISHMIRTLGLEKDVIVADYVSIQDLVHFYHLADFFVYPSLYEGFGLPVLEAMACGTPVLCSNAASLPEVVGDAALMFDPYNTGEMAENMIRMIENDALKTGLRELGLRQAGKFSWDVVAARIEDTYESVAAEKS